METLQPGDLALIDKVVNDACLARGCDENQRQRIAARVLGWAAIGARDYGTLFAVAIFQCDALNAGSNENRRHERNTHAAA
jgi:hypothetical protein